MLTVETLIVFLMLVVAAILVFIVFSLPKRQIREAYSKTETVKPAGAGSGKKFDAGEDKGYSCSVCGREISEEDYESYDGMCWECWDDQLTEESEDMFGDLM